MKYFLCPEKMLPSDEISLLSVPIIWAVFRESFCGIFLHFRFKFGREFLKRPFRVSPSSSHVSTFPFVCSFCYLLQCNAWEYLLLYILDIMYGQGTQTLVCFGIKISQTDLQSEAISFSLSLSFSHLPLYWYFHLISAFPVPFIIVVVVVTRMSLFLHLSLSFSLFPFLIFSNLYVDASNQHSVACRLRFFFSTTKMCDSQTLLSSALLIFLLETYYTRVGTRAHTRVYIGTDVQRFTRSLSSHSTSSSQALTQIRNHALQHTSLPHSPTRSRYGPSHFGSHSSPELAFWSLAFIGTVFLRLSGRSIGAVVFAVEMGKGKKF